MRTWRQIAPSVSATIEVQKNILFQYVNDICWQVSRLCYVQVTTNFVWISQDQQCCFQAFIIYTLLPTRISKVCKEHIWMIFQTNHSVCFFSSAICCPAARISSFAKCLVIGYYTPALKKIILYFSYSQQFATSINLQLLCNKTTSHLVHIVYRKGLMIKDTQNSFFIVRGIFQSIIAHPPHMMWLRFIVLRRNAIACSYPIHTCNDRKGYLQHT